MQILSVSIDLTKIDKSKIIIGKTGAKYYNINVIVKDEKDQYGNDVSVANGQTKEQREAKEKSVFIGSGRIVYTKTADSQTVEAVPMTDNNIPDPNIDLPF